jgi:hypothetical protein
MPIYLPDELVVDQIYEGSSDERLASLNLGGYSVNVDQAVEFIIWNLQRSLPRKRVRT